MILIGVRMRVKGGGGLVRRKGRAMTDTAHTCQEETSYHFK